MTKTIKHFWRVIVLIGLVVFTPLGVFLVSRTQIFKSRAFVNPLYTTTLTGVKLKMTIPTLVKPIFLTTGKYGLAQNPSEAGILQLPNPPLFSYGLYNVASGNIHTFKPCDNGEELGCVIDKNAITITIQKENDLKNYIRSNPNHYWTIFNEPELGGYWSSTPEQYAKIWYEYTRVLTESFGGDTSQFKMFFPGMGTNAEYQSWMNQVIDRYKALYGVMRVDAWTFHAYPGSQSCELPNDYSAGMNTTRSLINGFISFINQLDGGRYATTPIWLTEWGWIRNHKIPNNLDTPVANTPCVTRYIYDVMNFLENDPIAKTRITKVFYFPFKINAAPPGQWPDGDYPVYHPGWPAWSGWLVENNKPTDPGKMYSCIVRKDQSSCPQLQNPDLAKVTFSNVSLRK